MTYVTTNRDHITEMLNGMAYSSLAVVTQCFVYIHRVTTPCLFSKMDNLPCLSTSHVINCQEGVLMYRIICLHIQNTRRCIQQ